MTAVALTETNQKLQSALAFVMWTWLLHYTIDKFGYYSLDLYHDIL